MDLKFTSVSFLLNAVGIIILFAVEIVGCMEDRTQIIRGACGPFGGTISNRKRVSKCEKACYDLHDMNHGHCFESNDCYCLKSTLDHNYTTSMCLSEPDQCYFVYSVGPHLCQETNQQACKFVCKKWYQSRKFECDANGRCHCYEYNFKKDLQMLENDSRRSLSSLSSTCQKSKDCKTICPAKYTFRLCMYNNCYCLKSLNDYVPKKMCNYWTDTQSCEIVYDLGKELCTIPKKGPCNTICKNAMGADDYICSRQTNHCKCFFSYPKLSVGDRGTFFPMLCYLTKDNCFQTCKLLFGADYKTSMCLKDTCYCLRKSGFRNPNFKSCSDDCVDDINLGRFICGSPDDGACGETCLKEYGTPDYQCTRGIRECHCQVEKHFESTTTRAPKKDKDLKPTTLKSWSDSEETGPSALKLNTSKVVTSLLTTAVPVASKFLSKRGSIPGPVEFPTMKKRIPKQLATTKKRGQIERSTTKKPAREEKLRTEKLEPVERATAKKPEHKERATTNNSEKTLSTEKRVRQELFKTENDLRQGMQRTQKRLRNTIPRIKNRLRRKKTRLEKRLRHKIPRTESRRRQVNATVETRQRQDNATVGNRQRQEIATTRKSEGQEMSTIEKSKSQHLVKTKKSGRQEIPATENKNPPEIATTKKPKLSPKSKSSTKDPVKTKPSVIKPSTQNPLTRKHSTTKPSTKNPLTKEPPITEPSTKKTSAEKPITTKRPVHKRGSGKNTASTERTYAFAGGCELSQGECMKLCMDKYASSYKGYICTDKQDCFCLKAAGFVEPPFTECPSRFCREGLSLGTLPCQKKYRRACGQLCELEYETKVRTCNKGDGQCYCVTRLDTIMGTRMGFESIKDVTTDIPWLINGKFNKTMSELSTIEDMFGRVIRIPGNFEDETCERKCKESVGSKLDHSLSTYGDACYCLKKDPDDVTPDKNCPDGNCVSVIDLGIGLCSNSDRACSLMCFFKFQTLKAICNWQKKCKCTISATDDNAFKQQKTDSKKSKKKSKNTKPTKKPIPAMSSTEKGDDQITSTANNLSTQDPQGKYTDSNSIQGNPTNVNQPKDNSHQGNPGQANQLQCYPEQPNSPPANLWPAYPLQGNQAQANHLQSNPEQANQPQSNLAQYNQPKGNLALFNQPQSNTLQSSQSKDYSGQAYQLQVNPSQTNQPQTYTMLGNEPQIYPTQPNQPRGNPEQNNQPLIHPTQANRPQGNLGQPSQRQSVPAQANQSQRNPTQINQQHSYSVQPNQPLCNPSQANQPQVNPSQANQSQFKPTQTNQFQISPTQTNQFQISPTQYNQPQVNQANRPQGYSVQANKPETNAPQGNQPHSIPVEANQPQAISPQSNQVNGPQANPSDASKVQSSPKQVDQPPNNQRQGNPTQTNQPQSNEDNRNPQQSNKLESYPSPLIQTQSNLQQGDHTQGNSPQGNPPQSIPVQAIQRQANPTQVNQPLANPDSAYQPPSNPSQGNHPQANPKQGNQPLNHPTQTNQPWINQANQLQNNLANVNQPQGSAVQGISLQGSRLLNYPAVANQPQVNIPQANQPQVNPPQAYQPQANPPQGYPPLENQAPANQLPNTPSQTNQAQIDQAKSNQRRGSPTLIKRPHGNIAQGNQLKGTPNQKGPPQSNQPKSNPAQGNQPQANLHQVNQPEGILEQAKQPQANTLNVIKPQGNQGIPVPANQHQSNLAQTLQPQGSSMHNNQKTFNLAEAHQPQFSLAETNQDQVYQHQGNQPQNYPAPANQSQVIQPLVFPMLANQPRANPRKGNGPQVNPPQSNQTQVNPVVANQPQSKSGQGVQPQSVPVKAVEPQGIPRQSAQSQASPSHDNQPQINPSQVYQSQFRLAPSNQPQKNPPPDDQPQTNLAQVNQPQSIPMQANQLHAHISQGYQPQGNPAPANYPQGNPSQGSQPQSSLIQTVKALGSPAQNSLWQSNPAQDNLWQSNPAQTYKPLLTLGNPDQKNKIQSYPVPANHPQNYLAKSNSPQAIPLQDISEMFNSKQYVPQQTIPTKLSAINKPSEQLLAIEPSAETTSSVVTPIKPSDFQNVIQSLYQKRLDELKSLFKPETNVSYDTVYVSPPDYGPETNVTINNAAKSGPNIQSLEPNAFQTYYVAPPSYGPKFLVTDIKTGKNPVLPHTPQIYNSSPEFEQENGLQPQSERKFGSSPQLQQIDSLPPREQQNFGLSSREQEGYGLPPQALQSSSSTSEAHQEYSSWPQRLVGYGSPPQPQQEFSTPEHVSPIEEYNPETLSKKIIVKENKLPYYMESKYFNSKKGASNYVKSDPRSENTDENLESLPYYLQPENNGDALFPSGPDSRYGNVQVPDQEMQNSFAESVPPNSEPKNDDPYAGTNFDTPYDPEVDTNIHQGLKTKEDKTEFPQLVRYNMPLIEDQQMESGKNDENPNETASELHYRLARKSNDPLHSEMKKHGHRVINTGQSKADKVKSLLTGHKSETGFKLLVKDTELSSADYKPKRTARFEPDGSKLFEILLPKSNVNHKIDIGKWKSIPNLRKANQVVAIEIPSSVETRTKREAPSTVNRTVPDHSANFKYTGFSRNQSKVPDTYSTIYKKINKSLSLAQDILKVNDTLNYKDLDTYLANLTETNYHNVILNGKKLKRISRSTSAAGEASSVSKMKTNSKGRIVCLPIFVKNSDILHEEFDGPNGTERLVKKGKRGVTCNRLTDTDIMSIKSTSSGMLSKSSGRDGTSSKSSKYVAQFNDVCLQSSEACKKICLKWIEKEKLESYYCRKNKDCFCVNSAVLSNKIRNCDSGQCVDYYPLGNGIRCGSDKLSSETCKALCDLTTETNKFLCSDTGLCFCVNPLSDLQHPSTPPNPVIVKKGGCLQEENVCFKYCQSVFNNNLESYLCFQGCDCICIGKPFKTDVIRTCDVKRQKCVDKFKLGSALQCMASAREVKRCLFICRNSLSTYDVSCDSDGSCFCVFSNLEIPYRLPPSNENYYVLTDSGGCKMGKVECSIFCRIEMGLSKLYKSFCTVDKTCVCASKAFLEKPLVKCDKSTRVCENVHNMGRDVKCWPTPKDKRTCQSICSHFLQTTEFICDVFQQCYCVKTADVSPQNAKKPRKPDRKPTSSTAVSGSGKPASSETFTTEISPRKTPEPAQPCRKPSESLNLF